MPKDARHGATEKDVEDADDAQHEEGETLPACRFEYHQRQDTGHHQIGASQERGAPGSNDAIKVQKQVSDTEQGAYNANVVDNPFAPRNLPIGAFILEEIQDKRGGKENRQVHQRRPVGPEDRCIDHVNRKKTGKNAQYILESGTPPNMLLKFEAYGTHGDFSRQSTLPLLF